METQEEDNALNIDSLMEHSDIESENEYCIENIPLYFLKDNTIEFGFFEQSTNTFYSIEIIKNANFRIKHATKILEVSTEIDNNTKRYFYKLTNNFPTMIKTNDEKNIFLQFSKPPNFAKNKEYEEPSDFLMSNYNKLNNLLCLDSPYRCIYIPDCPKKVLEQIYYQIFFIEKKEESIISFNYLNFNNYIKNVEILKNKITTNNFYDTYINYANISETLQRRKFESILSIYDNFKSDFKIQKYPSEKQKDKNLNDFYVMKHIAITPYSIKIKKESFHQSSRFLRLYFHNDNFIKIEFKDENDSQLYSNSPHMHNTEKLSGMSKLYDLVFKNGFNLCGKKYLFFLNPTNCMRANCLWLLEENEYHKKREFYYKDLGLYSIINNKNIQFSKILSRLSQNFTSSYSFNNINKKRFECEIINDIKTENNEIYNDGCGKISYELLKEICNDLNKGDFASAIQIRYKGAKGVLVVNPLIKNKKIILTKSMIKYNCENTEDLEIIRFSKYSPGYLNLQIIILLILSGISKNRIYSIAKKEVCNYRNYKIVKENLPIKNSEFDKVMKDIQKQNNILKIQKDYMSKIARSTFIYNRLSNISKKYRFHMKNCCFLLGVCDFDNILNENEVFVQICKNGKNKKIIIGDILITKNPCLSVFDLQKVKAVNNKYFSEYFFNVIVFPCKGKIPLPSKITGSDLDGDIYWVCWENSFLKEIKYRDYSDRVKILKNEQNYPTEISKKYINNEKGERIKNYFIKVNTTNYNITEDQKYKNLSFLERCLNFHIFFHKNYKLPEINKNYLAYISDLLTKDNLQKELNISELESYAFYHGVEVDFQKAGETSNFIGKLKQPSFLMKRIQQRNSNCLIKLKEIYDQYKRNQNLKKEIFNNNINNNISLSPSLSDSIHKNFSNDDNFSTYSGSNNINDNNENSFYDFFIKVGNNQTNEFNHKFLKLYEKKRLVNDMYENSFIYKLYEMVSVFAPMQEAFLTSIYLISEEYFLEQNLKNNIFSFTKNIFKLKDYEIKNILHEISEINNNYENEIKYIMAENEISIEIEIIYLTDFIEPKIAVFKNDTEDYKLNLNEQIKFAKNNSINNLETLRKKHKASVKDISNLLFWIVFWIPGYDVSLIEEKENEVRKINVDDQIRRKNRIISRREFVENIVKQGGLDQIKSYFYEHLKCFSLYNFYSNIST